MKRPNHNWINDWEIGEMGSRESKISNELINIFIKFWNELNLDDKSKSTQNRYSASLHALGGYLVEYSIDEECLNMNTTEILNANVGPDEGPLIHHDDEKWQNEIDMVCRQLFKYIVKNV